MWWLPKHLQVQDEHLLDIFAIFTVTSKNYLLKPRVFMVYKDFSIGRPGNANKCAPWKQLEKGFKLFKIKICMKALGGKQRHGKLWDQDLGRRQFREVGLIFGSVFPIRYLQTVENAAERLRNRSRKASQRERGTKTGIFGLPRKGKPGKPVLDWDPIRVIC